MAAYVGKYLNTFGFCSHVPINGHPDPNEYREALLDTGYLMDFGVMETQFKFYPNVI